MTLEQPAYILRQGQSALLVSMPHVGTHLPAWLMPRMTRDALALPDTDWHIERLYDFLDELDATVLAATHSRYVVDLNRAPDGTSLYPGRSVTGLCPLDTFDEQPVYLPGREPDAIEVVRRTELYWQPYHTALEAELERLKGLHGRAMLWDAHSIRSRVPRFFEGELPHFSLGTADHAACNVKLAERIHAIALGHAEYSCVMNGRFKGGYITRHYGRPEQGVHAVQLELAQRAYMQELPPFELDTERMRRIKPALQSMLHGMLSWHRALSEQ